MATVPTSATKIRFLTGIPFFVDYQNVRHFSTKTEQDSYFNSRTLVHEMTDCSFQRDEKGSFIRATGQGGKLYPTSYVVFQNPDYNNKTFYAFVTNIEYVNNVVTKVYFEIDVYQTWLFDITWKSSYIDREHTRLYDGDGQPILNTIPESLEKGSTYEIVNEIHVQPSDLLFLVIVSSKEITDGSPETRIGVIGTPTPLYIYIVPYDRSSGIPIKLNDNLLAPFPTLMREFSENEELVKAIQTMYVTDYAGINFAHGDGIDYSSSDVTTRPLKGSTFHVGVVKDLFNFRNTQETVRDIYSKFKSVSESKLLMYPYCLIELDDLKGNRLELQPELLMGNSIDIVIKGNIGYTNKVQYEVKNYNTKALEFVSTLQNSIIDLNPNDIPVVTDFLSAMMQGQRNSIQARKDNSQTRGIVSAVNAGVSGVATGITNPGAGIATASMGVYNAGKNYEMETKSINAQLQDASAIPPNVGNMGGITSFDYGYNLTGLRVVFKQIRQEYINTLTDYFRKFGYKVNRLKIPNLKTRQNFNYVRTVGCNISGNMNNEDLQTIKNIFDRGVTLWHINDIGNYGIGNEVI